jgi:hypothetical protein
MAHTLRDGLAGDSSLYRLQKAGKWGGALAQRQRSALVALACPDLPPSALSGRLHLQAQQRARSALGRHERACASGYRPHLRAAATARSVLAVDAGLAPADEAAAARQRAAMARGEACVPTTPLSTQRLIRSCAHR